jgi:hypothetical protein
MDNLKINKGIELMLRGANKKEEKEEKPPKGFSITRFFTLLKRQVYFNLELWWHNKES